jgi:hypothetical protein
LNIKICSAVPNLSSYALILDFKAEISLAFVAVAALAPISPFHLATSPDLIKSNSDLFKCSCFLPTASFQSVIF